MSAPDTKCGTVAIVGRPNVGKSTLLNSILGAKIAATTHKPQTTRRALRGVDTKDDVQLVFVDTPGLHAPKKGLHQFMIDEALEAARGVDVIVVMIEAKGQSVFKGDEAILHQLASAGVKAPMILAINKVDLLKDKSALLPFLQAWSARGGFEAYVPLSARSKKGVDALMKELRERAPKGPFLFPADALTDVAEKDICAELIREKVMLERPSSSRRWTSRAAPTRRRRSCASARWCTSRRTRRRRWSSARRARASRRSGRARAKSSRSCSAAR
jgi:GTP-binding protein Era